MTRPRLGNRRGLIFLPYGTQRPIERFPYATYSLIGLNLLIWVGCVLSGARYYQEVVVPRWGLVPATFRWDAFFVSLFLHDAPLPFHVGLNMFFLWLFGRHVEDALGPVLFLVAYFVGGAAAHTLNVFMATQFVPTALGIPTIGASGAIAGIMGIYAVRFYQTKPVALLGVGLPPVLGFARQVRLPSIAAVGIWVGWELLQGVLAIGTGGEGGGVAYWAHIGGAAFGALAALGLGLRGEAQDVYSLDNAYDLFRQGEWLRAATCFQGVIQDQPRNADAHVKLAVCWDLLNRGPQAQRAYLRAMELYLASGEMDMGLDAFSRLARRYRTKHLPPAEYLRLAGLFAERGEHEDAARCYEMLADAHPRALEAERAVVEGSKLLLRNLGRPQQALQWLQAFKQSRPSSALMTEADQLLAEAQARGGAGTAEPV